MKNIRNWIMYADFFSFQENIFKERLSMKRFMKPFSMNHYKKGFQ